MATADLNAATQPCLSPNKNAARAYCNAEKAAANTAQEVDACGWLDAVYSGVVNKLMCVKEFCKAQWDAQIFDLIAAYGAVNARQVPVMHVVARRHVMTLDEAITRLSRLIGSFIDWTEISRFVPQSDDPVFRKSALASSFVAALELAKQGRIELKQDEAFAPLMVRAA